jgi:hypothetical protein
MCEHKAAEQLQALVYTTRIVTVPDDYTDYTYCSTTATITATANVTAATLLYTTLKRAVPNCTVQLRSI